MRTRRHASSPGRSLTFNEPGRAPLELLPFTQQAAEATDTFYRTTQAGNKTEVDTRSLSECKIDQPATAWAYCEEKYEGSYTKQPEGSNVCIGRRDQYLMIVEGTVDDYRAEVATKVAN